MGWQTVLSVRLAFGCRSGPRVFDMLSEALCWILGNEHQLLSLHLLDDFGSRFSVDSARLLRLGVEGHIRLPGHSAVLRVDGRPVYLWSSRHPTDSVSMWASLPSEKLERVHSVMRVASGGAALMAGRDLLSKLYQICIKISLCIMP